MAAHQKLEGLYDAIEHLLRAGMFDRLNADMLGLHVTDADEILAWLTATLPAKSRLPARGRLVEAARGVLSDEELEGLT